MPTPGPMTEELVLGLLDGWQQAGVDVWVAGGWGVDALVGRQTREHRDLDVLHRHEQEGEVLSSLTELGYVPESDWWPVRLELAGPSYVDVHPLRFAPDGGATQTGLDGTELAYPADAFTHGRIGGRRVGCLSVAQQLAFHAGYEPRDVDRHDLDQLRRLRGDAKTGLPGDLRSLICGDPP